MVHKVVIVVDYMGSTHIWHVKIGWSSCAWSWCVSSFICLTNVFTADFPWLESWNYN